MTELRNVPAELTRFRLRVGILGLAMLFGAGLLIARFVNLQVLRHDDLSERAENNRTAIVPTVPERGAIYDRNGVLLAGNLSAFSLDIVPAQTPDVEQTIQDIGKLIELSKRDIQRFRKLRSESKDFDAFVLRPKLTEQEAAIIAANQYRLPGVQVNQRLHRYYPMGEVASHVIGYIGRINERDKQAIEEREDVANYRGTLYMGKVGIEASYEHLLHGTTGVNALETSAGGRATRTLTSSPAIAGKHLTLSLDIQLQKHIEDAFGNRRGTLVAIDPKTGQVLALVSKPTFDPNLFVEGIDTETWQSLNESLDKPLLNRALRGTYPPGSTYKPFMALAAQELGVRSPDRVIYDGGVFQFGNHRFRGHAVGAVNMRESIAQSSNVYYYSLAQEMGAERIHDFMKPLGFGERTGIDLPGEVRGVLPNQEWKRKTFKRPAQQQWFTGETISLGIGQGYNSFTILQLANATATLANGGTKFTPSTALKVSSEGAAPTPFTPPNYLAPQNLGFDPNHIRVVHEGLVGVVQRGTAARVFAGASYRSAGKTGTAQAVTIGQNARYNASRLSEYQRDHSLYMGYAPAEDPQIALAVIVENAGFGAEFAAPIARKAFDYWLIDRFKPPVASTSTDKTTPSPIKAPATTTR